MNRSISSFRRLGVAGVAALIVITGATGLVAASIPNTSAAFHACMKKGAGTIRVINYPATSECLTGERLIQWSEVGPRGPKGATGETGAKGPKGDEGPRGPAGPVNAFVVPYTNGPCSGLGQRIDSPLTNGKPDVLIFITQRVYSTFDGDLAVRYHRSSDDTVCGGYWYITAGPATAWNVLVVEP